MKAYNNILRIILTILLLGLVNGTGKGPVGIYGLTKRFVVFGDFNFDAIFIIDMYMGGIVGQLVMHEEEYDPENQGVSYQDVEGGTFDGIENWTKPIGLTTCDTCLDLWMTSHKRFNFYRIHLTRPLKEMADKADFTEFADSVIEPYNPWGLQQEQPFDDGQYRYMAMKRDGSVGFFSHRVYGLFQFMERNENGQNVFEVPGSKLIADDSQLMGVTMNQDDTRLLVVSEKYVYVYDINGPPSLITKYNLEENCRGEFNGKMFFFDSVMVENGDIYGVAKAYRSNARAGIGMQLFRIESDGSDVWGNCQVVTGGFNDFAGWVDGDGDTVRLTRPHAMNLLPGTGSIVLTDIESRAIRVADVSKMPVHVSTVSYDEGLWERLYVSESCSESQDVGVPREVPNAKSSMNFLQAKEKCNGENERLCSLAELRGYWSQEPLQAGRTITTWTDQDCHSCWLHHYGVCFPPSEDDSQSTATLAGSAWGSENQMLAFLATSTEGMPTVQTECTNKNKVIETDVVCCPQHEHARFHGRVSSNDNENKGHQGPISVKLVRRQPSPSKFKYTTVSKVQTEEDGTFEVSLQSVCNDSMYYLKFILDKGDFEHEFVSTEETTVKKGKARSTPTRISHGNDYEINAAVRPKACHRGDPATFRGRVWVDMNANAEMDNSEQGYPGIMSVKLIRRQPSPPKFQYTEEKVVFTNEDGTFEILLESVCDDSMYYLKFELDEEDYEFIPGGDIFVKREIGYSSPTSIVHGGLFDINAGVRPETPRIESNKVP